MTARADRSWVRALAVAVAVAEAAALALRPRRGVLPGLPTAADAHFGAAEIARARRYGIGQLALGAAAAGVETAVLVALVRRDRGRAHAEFVPAAVGLHSAKLSVGLALAPLPLQALMRRRALAAGIATQSWRGWALDVVRSAALAAGFTAAGSVVVAALMRRFDGRWWLPASAGSVVVATAITLAGPVLLEPLFNDFTPLPDGELRREVLALARRAGVRVGEVYAVDASRRTSAANAYVSGLGATRRVVLFDTLLEGLPADEARVVVAHELAHVAHRDVPRMLVFFAFAAPAGTRAVARLAERVEGSARPGLPSLALAGGAVSAALGVVARQLSRAVERRADTFSLELTGDPGAFIAFERRISRQNLADPDPPRWLWRLLATHPPIVERIGIASAWEAGARPATRRLRGPLRSLRTRAGS